MYLEGSDWALTGHAFPEAAPGDGRGTPKADGRGTPKADGRGKPKADGRGKPKADGRVSRRLTAGSIDGSKKAP
jgi:hypothetical protein